MAMAAAATSEFLGDENNFFKILLFCKKKLFDFSGDKDQDMEREREFYDYQHESSTHPIHAPSQAQTVHLSPNHPHLRHIGHPQTSIICIQPPHNSQPPSLITNNPPASSHNSVVQNHTSQPSINDSMNEIQLKKEANKTIQNQTHFHQQQNGELRPSVIESNQPMVIECT